MPYKNLKIKKQKAREYYLKNKEHLRELGKKWHLANKAANNEKSKLYASTHKLERSMYSQKELIKQKALLFVALGNCCEVCGDSDFRHLQVDHRLNDGAEHRKEQHVSGGNWYRQLRDMPDLRRKLALLCANCHCEKTFEEDGFAKGTRIHSRISPQEIRAIFETTSRASMGNYDQQHLIAGHASA